MILSGKTGTIILVILILTVLISVSWVLFHKTGVEISEESTRKTPEEAVKEGFVKQLQRALADKNAKEVTSLMKSISAMGPTAVPPLVSAFKKNNNPEFQIVIIKTMGLIPDKTVLTSLQELYVTYAKQQPDFNVQKEIILTLSRLGGRDIFDTFINYLKIEKNQEIKNLLGNCLVAIGDTSKIDSAIKDNQSDPQLVQTLMAVKSKTEQDKTQRDVAIEINSLDLSGETAIKKLEDILKSEQSLSLRIFALQKLEQANSEPAVEVLLGFAEIPDNGNESNKTIKLNTIAALARMKINEARLAVKKLLANENLEIRRNTVEFLGAFGDSGSIPLLNQVISGDSSTEIRQKAGESILKIKQRNLK